MSPIQEARKLCTRRLFAVDSSLSTVVDARQLFVEEHEVNQAGNGQFNECSFQRQSNTVRLSFPMDP